VFIQVCISPTHIYCFCVVTRLVGNFFSPLHAVNFVVCQAMLGTSHILHDLGSRAYYGDVVYWLPLATYDDIIRHKYVLTEWLVDLCQRRRGWNFEKVGGRKLQFSDRQLHIFDKRLRVLKILTLSLNPHPRIRAFYPKFCIFEENFPTVKSSGRGNVPPASTPLKTEVGKYTHATSVPPGCLQLFGFQNSRQLESVALQIRLWDWASLLEPRDHKLIWYH